MYCRYKAHFLIVIWNFRLYLAYMSSVICHLSAKNQIQTSHATSDECLIYVFKNIVLLIPYVTDNRQIE